MTETLETHVPEGTTKVMQRVAAEPAFRKILYKILDFCQSPRSSAQVEQEVLSYPEMQASLQPYQVLLTWLVQCAGIEQAAAEGEPFLWRTTPAGMHVARISSLGERLALLAAQSQVYRDIYHQILQSCVVPKTKEEIESMLHDNPALENSGMYPSFFIGELEEAGGLDWADTWRTTEAGKTFLNEWFAHK